MFDKEAIKASVTSMIKALGEDPEREGLVDTPRRVAEMYEELFMGMGKDPVAELSVGYEESHREMVVLKDIPFYSMCEHHLLPFYGVVHIGYIPNKDGRVVGISKLARVVDCFARRLQVQERLTVQVADFLMENLKPKGVAVVIEASHSCMTIRGVKKPESAMVTSALRGIFIRDSRSRSEVLGLMNINR